MKMKANAAQRSFWSGVITDWYPSCVTTVDIVFRYATLPTEQVSLALARARDVYGIRRLSIDREAHTLRIEYDATRLSAAAVTKLVREAGLDIAEDEPLLAAPPPAPTIPPAA
jgi:hypothetical protein